MTRHPWFPCRRRRPYASLGAAIQPDSRFINIFLKELLGTAIIATDRSASSSKRLGIHPPDMYDTACTGRTMRVLHGDDTMRDSYAAPYRSGPDGSTSTRTNNGTHSITFHRAPGHVHDSQPVFFIPGKPPQPAVPPCLNISILLFSQPLYYALTRSSLQTTVL